MKKEKETLSNGLAERTLKSNLVASSDRPNVTQTSPSNQDIPAYKNRFKQLPSRSELSRMMLHEEDTGELFSRLSRGNLLEGSKCGTSNPEKHTRLSINCEDYMASRLIWKMQFGADPKGIIIHRNGNPSDNRIANLSEVVR